MKWIFALNCWLSLLWPALADGQAFSLATYNVYDVEGSAPQRAGRLLAHVAERSPDVILLQEAPAAARDWAGHAKGLEPYDYFAQTKANGAPEGGLAILAKRALGLKHLSYRPLPSELGRGLLAGTVMAGGIPHRLVNVHLESDVPFARSAYFRGRQLAVLGELARNQPALLIGGDFNIGAGDAEEALIPPSLSDIWARLFPKDPGYTWDRGHNPLARKSGYFFERSARLDRVLSQSPVLVPERMERLGVDASPPDSDHYGLWVLFGAAKN